MKELISAPRRNLQRLPPSATSTHGRKTNMSALGQTLTSQAPK